MIPIGSDLPEVGRSAEHEAARRKVAFRLDDTLRDYYPEGVEKRRTVCFHLADDIIDLLGGADHYVTFDQDGWFVEHSVPCRLVGNLGTCAYNAAIRDTYDDDPDQDGRWRITGIDEEGLPSLERVPASDEKGAGGSAQPTAR